MLKELTIDGFRAFDHFELKELTRVNLVVGENNSGKTTLLEAVELLDAKGSPAVITEMARRRDELGSVTGRVGSYLRLPSIAHLLHGHECKPGAQFKIHAGQSGNCLSFEVRPLEELIGTAKFDPLDVRYPDEAIPAMCLAISTYSGAKTSRLLHVTDRGLLLPSLRPLRTGPSSARFVSLSSTAPVFMNEVWNQVVSEGRDSEVVDDLRLFLPNIESIHFLTADQAAHGRVVVGLRDPRARVPLLSFGDGFCRLLQLRLSLATTNSTVKYVSGRWRREWIALDRYGWNVAHDC